MVAQSELKVEMLEKFISLSDLALEVTKQNFKQSELYFSFTHLVCRSAFPSSQRSNHMSHDIHADNCINFSNGTCSRKLPAFSWRDFSVIVYLNEDFQGGELVFVADSQGKVVQVKIISCVNQSQTIIKYFRKKLNQSVAE